MFKNHLIIAIRNLKRNRVYTFLNVAGLALGMACSLILLLIIDFELSFDDYHANRERIYRTTQHLTVSGGSQTYSSAQYPMAEALRTDFPQLEAVAMTSYDNSARISVVQDDGSRDEFTEHQSIAFVEPSIFDILSFTPVHGNLEAALETTTAAVISESRVRRYFGLAPGEEGDAIGETLQLNGQTNYTIAVVIQDPPANTDFPFSLMVPFKSQKGTNEFYDAFNWHTSHTELNCYFLAPGEFDLADFERQLVPFMDKYRGEGASELRKFVCQPLEDIHFNDQYSNYTYRTVSMDRLWIMALIAAVLIATAAINFINLASAQASKRIREVSIRKIMGSSKWQLILQFFSENLGLTFLAMIISLVMAELMIVNFSGFIQLGEGFSLFASPGAYGYLVVLGVIVGLLSGLYPALNVAAFNALGGLRNTHLDEKPGSMNIRKVLVTGQFIITQVLIIGTLVVHAQLEYFRSLPLHFDSDSHLVFNLPHNEAEKLQLLSNELSAIPGLGEVTYTLGPPQTDSYFETAFGLGEGAETQELRTEVKPANHHFFDTFGLEFVAGGPYRSTDSTALVINETMLKVQGYDVPSGILGQKISIFDGHYPVVGVVKDFHSRSLQHGIPPMVITSFPRFYFEGVVRVNLSQASYGELSEVLSRVEDRWQVVFPGEVFDGYYLDQYLAGKYEQEQNTASLVMTFTLVAIIIGAMGLYGLVSFFCCRQD